MSTIPDCSPVLSIDRSLALLNHKLVEINSEINNHKSKTLLSKILEYYDQFESLQAHIEKIRNAYINQGEQMLNNACRKLETALWEIYNANTYENIFQEEEKQLNYRIQLIEKAIQENQYTNVMNIISEQEVTSMIATIGKATKQIHINNTNYKHFKQSLDEECKASTLETKYKKNTIEEAIQCSQPDHKEAEEVKVATNELLKPNEEYCFNICIKQQCAFVYDHHLNKIIKQKIGINASKSCAICPHDGKVVMCGGVINSKAKKSTYLLHNYNFTLVSKIPKMCNGKFNHTIISYSNSIVVLVGGDEIQANGEIARTKKCQIFDFASNKWSKMSELNIKRRKCTLVVVSKYVYALKGNQQITNFCERANPIEKGKWEKINFSSKFPDVNKFGTIPLAENSFLIIGGEKEGSRVFTLVAYKVSVNDDALECSEYSEINNWDSFKNRYPFRIGNTVYIYGRTNKLHYSDYPHITWKEY